MNSPVPGDMEKSSYAAFFAPACAAVLLAVLLAVYGGMLPSPLESDAAYLTTENSFVREPGVGGLYRIWTSEFFAGAMTGTEYAQVSGYYRPVTNTIFWFEYRIFGENPFGYRLDQLLIHWFNAVLVYFLALGILGAGPAAMFTAAVFALHPINAHAATEVGARSDVLFMFFYLSAMLTYSAGLARFHQCRDGGWKYMAVAAACYLLSVMSKEMGATLPVELLVLHLFLARTGRVPLGYAKYTAIFWGALAGYFVFRVGVLGIMPQKLGYAENIPAVALYLGLLKNISIYLIRIVMPIGAEYPELFPTLINFVDPALSVAGSYFSLAVVLGLVTSAGLAYFHSPKRFFPTSFFLVTMLPLAGVNNISGTLDLTQIIAQERWVYLPGLGIFMLAGYFLLKLWSVAEARISPAQSGGIKAVTVAGAICALLFLSNAAYIHGRAVENPAAVLKWYMLFPDDYFTSRFHKANKLVLLANLKLLPEGRVAEAGDVTARAVELVPDSPIPAVSRAAVLEITGGWIEIEQLLDPWFGTDEVTLRRHALTNFRVADDFNRSAWSVALILGRAKAYLGKPDDAARRYCAAENIMRTSQLDRNVIELMALYGSPKCIESADPAKCAAGSAISVTDRDGKLAWFYKTCG